MPENAKERISGEKDMADYEVEEPEHPRRRESTYHLPTTYSKMSDSSSDSSWPSLAWSNIPIDRYKPDPPRKKGPTFWNSHQLVTLFAGQNKEAKSFLIHKDFACHYSPVLKAALNSNFIEGQTQSYRMEEDNHEAVHLLIHWFYTQVLDTQQPKERLTGKPKDNEDLALIQLWILADKLLIPELQNLVTGRIDSIRRITQAIPTGCLQSVYKDTSAGREPDWFTEHPEDFPHEMLIDFAAVWSRKMQEATKFGLMEETNITDFEVENPE
ncbi:uncharacterized protein K444DRAFT_637423 [Hyaloscypha bicolor E]|uniref:BTB domain-containing protein n=1 Tax=Hyaloscypha bicolor E TaxID=1095630 RepID=A0A2J6SN93_9HELO|nr:uncharacterized protein K444DRAFT_637423 [Hyaloscypha bicolor E]PMD52236.1 hypothetical protein K444DRAFT_637423 [Hyaloscypha bicolor E]